MTLDEWVQAVAGSSERRAQDALLAGRRNPPRGSSVTDLVSAVAAELAQNSLLSRRAQAKRLHAVLTSFRISDSQSESLAAVAKDLPAHLRLTIANALSRSARHHVYGSSPAPRSAGVAPEPVTRLEAQPQEDEGAPSDREPDQDADDSEGETAPPVVVGATQGRDDETRYSTVLLLAHPDHQDANRRLLAAADLDPVGVDSVERLEELLVSSAEVCAYVIDGSVLSTLDAVEQKDLFEILAGYSTFAPIRIHDSALALPHEEVAQIIKRSRRLASPVPLEAVSFEVDRTIRGSELSRYQRAARLLRSYEQSSFVLGDLSPSETHLLTAAVHARVESEDLDGKSVLGPVTLRFLPGGRSGARLVTATTGTSRTFVAKITTKRAALDEVLRFRVFVQHWDDHLLPECHFHGNAAIILSALVRGGGDPHIPAEPLESRLTELWNSQWMRLDQEQGEREATFLESALVRTADRLAELNSLTPGDQDLPAYVDPPITHLAALEDDGFDYGLDSSGTAARTNAVQRYRSLEEKAVVHGDIHLRNILVRGDTDVQLIDFAATGPGHPAIDLVRFELALYLGPVRQFEDAGSSVAFQKVLSVDGAPLNVLRERFPHFFECGVNGVCAAGMVAARKQAIDVLRLHGGDVRDYLATKFLVALQNLGIVGMNPGLARSVIAALAPEMAAW